MRRQSARCRTPIGSPASTPPFWPSRTRAPTCTSAPCLVFEGAAPGLRRRSSSRSIAACTSCRATARSSRSRRSAQARPVWVDDPHFNAGYHVRHTALPEPAGVEQLRNLAGRVFAQRLDRAKPLWEIWLVDRGRGRALRADLQDPPRLVDGVSGVDIATVLFDLEADPDPPPEPPPAVVPAARAERGHADRRRAGRARRARRSTRLRVAVDALAHPEQAAGRWGAPPPASPRWSRAGLQGAPPSPLNVRDRPAPALRVGGRRPRAVQGDQGRAGRHGQRRRADRGDRRAARAHAATATTPTASS